MWYENQTWGQFNSKIVYLKKNGIGIDTFGIDDKKCLIKIY